MTNDNKTIQCLPYYFVPVDTEHLVNQRSRFKVGYDLYIKDHPVNKDSNNPSKQLMVYNKGNMCGEFILHISLVEDLILPSDIYYSSGIFYPASSVRGMLRSFAEMVLNGCITTTKLDKKSEDKPNEKTDYDNCIDSEWKHEECNVSKGYCNVCQLFGHVDRNTSRGLGNCLALPSKIWVSEGRLITSQKPILRRTCKRMLYSPVGGNENNIYQSNIYIDKNGNVKLRGRKLYFARKSSETKFIINNLNDVQFEEKFVVMPKGAKYEVKLTYKDLKKEHFNALCAILLAMKDVHVQLGRAKAYGFGQCLVSVVGCENWTGQGANIFDFNLSPRLDNRKWVLAGEKCMNDPLVFHTKGYEIVKTVLSQKSKHTTIYGQMRQKQYVQYQPLTMLMNKDIIKTDEWFSFNSGKSGANNQNGKVKTCGLSKGSSSNSTKSNNHGNLMHTIGDSMKLKERKK